MRTILLLGTAAGSLLLAGHAHSAERLDYGVPTARDAHVYTGYPDRVPSEADYRHVEGVYQAEGRWTGTWDGTYEGPDGRRYRGSYEGTVEGRPGTSYAPPPAYDPYYDAPQYGERYDARYDEEMRRRCGNGGQIGGAVIGGIVGGVAGNRIAGRHHRTAGTLIGGGVGAIAGAAIGNEADRKKCEQWRASRSGAYQGGTYQGAAYPPPPPAYPAYPQGGYGYGYGYYTPGVVVTTIVSGPPIITETVETSTRTYYETVPVARKRVVVRKPAVKAKLRPKPRCTC